MAVSTKTALGFVGLGHMGGSMAARFLAAGIPVYGEARHRDDGAGARPGGLGWRDTPREVAEAAEVVFTSVPDDDVLEASRRGRTGSLPASTRRRSGST